MFHYHIASTTAEAFAEQLTMLLTKKVINPNCWQLFKYLDNTTNRGCRTLRLVHGIGRQSAEQSFPTHHPNSLLQTTGMKQCNVFKLGWNCRFYFPKNWRWLFLPSSRNLYLVKHFSLTISNCCSVHWVSSSHAFEKVLRSPHVLVQASIILHITIRVSLLK